MCNSKSISQSRNLRSAYYVPAQFKHREVFRISPLVKREMPLGYPATGEERAKSIPKSANVRQDPQQAWAGHLCKACRDAHSPMYLGSRGTETGLGNISQSGEEALLMIAGQRQAQIAGHHHCLHHKGSSEQTHRTGPDSGASSTLNP